MLVCGPSFGSGRYGYACGTLAREVARRGIPAVCGMDPESPGVAAAEGAAYIVPTSSNVAGMREALPGMAALARRLAEGEELGPPEDEGYLPRGLRRNEHAGGVGAARAIDLLLAKLAGETRTEVVASVRSGSAAAADPSRRGEAGAGHRGRLRPAGQPGRAADDPGPRLAPLSARPRRRCRRAATSPVHGGFDVTAANADPNRLVPLDVVAAPARRAHRDAPRRLLHDDRQRHPVAASVEVRAGDRRGAEGGRRRGRRPLGHLRDGHALRGNAGEEIERAGIPTVFVTALPTIATMIGANRVVRGVAITNPFGDPERSPAGERRSAEGSSSGLSRCSRPRSSPARSGRAPRETLGRWRVDGRRISTGPARAPAGPCCLGA